jgi:hypothetical protein
VQDPPTAVPLLRSTGREPTFSVKAVGVSLRNLNVINGELQKINSYPTILDMNGNWFKFRWMTILGRRGKSQHISVLNAFATTKENISFPNYRYVLYNAE